MSSGRLPSSFDTEDPSDRCYQKCVDQPLVPLGALATTGAVILAAHSLRGGRRKDAQKWFRWRVGLQGATVVALVGGALWQQDFKGNPENDPIRVKEAQLKEKAKMRERLWIQELERRDNEAKLKQRRLELAKLKIQEQERKEKEAAEAAETAKEKDSDKNTSTDEKPISVTKEVEKTLKND